MESKIEHSAQLDADMGSIRVPMFFLKELKLYEVEKPYRLRFRSPEPSIPRTNIQFEQIDDVLVQDIRHCAEPLDYEDTGFAMLHLDSPLTYEESYDETKLRNFFLADLKQLLIKLYKTPNIAVLKCTVSGSWMGRL